MNNSELSKLDAAKWLSDLGLSATGTKEELLQRISRYKRYLNETYRHYNSLKKQGSLGQQEKAHRMVQSRKIVCVKSLTDQNISYVKASIKKSYGHESRPATILFIDNVPKKANCPCPVGVSGLCCHTIALLLFLKHYTDTGEKILALTCTQQLQKWHRMSRGSIPMVPLNQIKLKSAKMRKNKPLVPADPDKSYFKRDVPSIIKKIQQNIRKCKPVTEHFHSVLSESKTGRVSSYGEHICFKFLPNSLGDHQYISKEDFEENILGIPRGKNQKLKKK